MTLNASQLESLPVGRHADGDGLYLQVTDSGSRLWRLRYRHNGRENMVSLGNLKTVSLSQARTKALQARAQVSAGESPSETKRAARLAAGDTFAALARQFLSHQSGELEQISLERNTRILEKHIIPVIGTKTMKELRAPDLTQVLRRMERTGHTETVRRARALLGRVFLYAIAEGICDHNVAADLDPRAFRAHETTHRAALIRPEAVGQLLRAIEAYRGQVSTRLALQLLPHLALRSGELRRMEWSWVDFERDEIRIPSHVMKMREEHVVPMSRQVKALLLDAKVGAITPRGFVFPSYVPGKVISDGTLNQALMRMGYSNEEHTPHGFRTTFSSTLNEGRKFDKDLIELQLAHKERNAVREAYNRAERLEERRVMMQWWSDYLDGIKATGRPE